MIMTVTISDLNDWMDYITKEKVIHPCDITGVIPFCMYFNILDSVRLYHNYWNIL